MRVRGAGQRFHIALLSNLEFEAGDPRLEALRTGIETLGMRADIVITHALSSDFQVTAFLKSGPLSLCGDPISAPLGGDRPGIDLQSRFTLGDAVPAEGVTADLVRGYLEGVSERWRGMVLTEFDYGGKHGSR